MPEPTKEEKTAPTAEDLEKLQAEVAQLKGRNAEYERLLLDPAYIEFIATRGESGTRPPAAAVRRAEDKEVDLDSMTNKDLFEYMLATIRGELAQKVEPLRTEQQFTEMQRQVKEAAEKHKDFWEYRDEMIRLARVNPALTAEDAYDIAKGRASRAPKKPAKPSEPPTGGRATTKEPPKGFEAKFLEAWNQAGLGASKEE